MEGSAPSFGGHGGLRITEEVFGRDLRLEPAKECHEPDEVSTGRDREAVDPVEHRHPGDAEALGYVLLLEPVALQDKRERKPFSLHAKRKIGALRPRVKREVIDSAYVASKGPQQIFLERLKALIPEGQARIYAKRAGVSEQTLSKWRTGAIPANPKLSTICRLAAALKLTPAEMISDEAVTVERVPADVARRVRSEVKRVRKLAEEINAFAEDLERRR